MWILRYKPTPESKWRPVIERKSLDACKYAARSIYKRVGSHGVFEILDPLGSVYLVSRDNQCWRMKWTKE